MKAYFVEAYIEGYVSECTLYSREKQPVFSCPGEPLSPLRSGAADAYNALYVHKRPQLRAPLFSIWCDRGYFPGAATTIQTRTFRTALVRAFAAIENRELHEDFSLQLESFYA